MNRLLAAATLLCLAAPAHALCPEITRDEIIKHAKSGVGSKYVWGGTCWDPNNRAWKGADCSGYVTKCWQIPAASKYTDCLSHYYTTASFDTGTTHWTAISRNDLIKGDALNYRSNGSGHIVIYYSGDKWGSAQVYEAKGTAYGIVYGTKTVSSSYKARRRHRLKSGGTTTDPHPLMTIVNSVQTIPNQKRDICQLQKSGSIFDWWVGQETEVWIDIKNSGTAVGKNVKLKVWVEEPYLKAVRWNIYTDWKASGSFILNDTDSMQKIPHNNPGKSFELWLSGFSVGETKRIKLRVKADRFSLGVVDHPDVRAWISSVDNFYSKADFSSTPNNVKGYQKQNSGDLRTHAQTDVLAKETCDKQDNDCDGKVDEDNVCGGGVKKDGGGDPGEDSRISGKKEAGTSKTDSGGTGSSDALAVPPPAFAHAEGCEVSGRQGGSRASTLAFALAFAFAFLALVRRRP